MGEYAWKVRKQFLRGMSYSKKGDARGVNHEKKVEILKKLTPFMDKENTQFWKDLPSDMNSRDLAINLEHFSSPKTFFYVNK